MGRYRITAELGRGSMGVVHLAHDPTMRRDVAVKTIYLPHGLSDQQRKDYCQRFLHEARVAGCLSHPGIVTIYDFDQSEETGLPFIAMEYIQGQTLHEVLAARHALEAPLAFETIDTLADALQSAHNAGIVHQDIKPANILIRESDGLAKIADFGIARINAIKPEDESSSYGSPAYMAPERIQGLPSDDRSDLFSLAVIFYEMLCGERPFGGDDLASICHSITQQPPVPITSRNPTLCRALNGFFDRALAKAPGDRFTNAAEFRESLQGVWRQQRMLDEGLATVRLATADDSTEGGEDWWSSSWFVIPGRWLVLGPALAILAVLGFALGWSLNSERPDDAGIERKVPAAAAELPHSARPIETAPAVDPAGPLIENTLVEVRPVQPPVAAPPVETPAEPVRKPDPAPAAAPAVPKSAPTNLTADSAEASAVTGIESAAAPAPVVSMPASVTLSISSSVKQGRLTVLVDGRQAFSSELANDSKKFKRFYRKALGQAHQQAGATFELPAGRHTISALLEVEGKSKRYERSIEIEVEAGGSQVLEIVAGKSFGRRLTLGVPEPAEAE